MPRNEEITRLVRRCKRSVAAVSFLGIGLPVAVIGSLWLAATDSLGTGAAVTLAFAAIIAGIVTVCVMLRRQSAVLDALQDRRWRVCPRCEYDIESLADMPVCPECGSPVSPALLERLWTTKIRSWFS